MVNVSGQKDFSVTPKSGGDGCFSLTMTRGLLQGQPA